MVIKAQIFCYQDTIPLIFICYVYRKENNYFTKVNVKQISDPIKDGEQAVLSKLGEKNLAGGSHQTWPIEHLISMIIGSCGQRDMQPCSRCSAKARGETCVAKEVLRIGSGTHKPGRSLWCSNTCVHFHLLVYPLSQHKNARKETNIYQVPLCMCYIIVSTIHFIL